MKKKRKYKKWVYTLYEDLGTIFMFFLPLYVAFMLGIGFGW